MVEDEWAGNSVPIPAHRKGKNLSFQIDQFLQYFVGRGDHA
jgi:hypothetical protein